MSRPVALYVHFPFCVSVCPYCDFVVYGGRAARGPANQVDRLVDALVAEIGLRGAAATPGAPLASVYVGGGTPSLMTAPHVERLLAATRRAFGIAADAEVTLELNPGAGERGDLTGFRAAGVSRVSIGAQSFDAAELRRLGRRHSPADIAATVAAARDAGLDNISVDLLYDVPGQSVDSFAASVDQAIALAPEHISAYSLSVSETEPSADLLPARPGALRWRREARVDQDADRAADCYELLDERLTAAGYAWYEISNWARPGRESRHNRVYWSGQAWQAVGPGAHAFDGQRTRSWNAARLDAYLAALAPADPSALRLPPGGLEQSSATVARAESVILALRTRSGVPASVSADPAFRAALAWAREHELTATERGRLRLTLRGRLMSNELFERLLGDDDRVEHGLGELQRRVPSGDSAANQHAGRGVEEVHLQATH